MIDWNTKVLSISVKLFELIDVLQTYVLRDIGLKMQKHIY